MVLAAAVVLAGSVPFAFAGGNPPVAAGTPDLGQGPGPNGTPVATGSYYDTAGPGDPVPWARIGGAPFTTDPKGPGADAMVSSPTPFTVDFFGVGFFDRFNGLAGGAACKDPGTAWADLGGCARVPAVYRYAVTPSEGWRRADLPGGDSPGYVGAVAWIDKTHAIAVGGDGVYPRREQATAVDDHSYKDQAGRARVWLYADGVWSELKNLPSTPSGTPMRGLTAVGCALTKAQHGQCVAGGLGQLWMFKDGSFYKSYDSTSDSSELQSPSAFIFRVRQIRFDPYHTYSTAVTAGCCATDSNNDGPEVLGFDGSAWSASRGSGKQTYYAFLYTGPQGYFNSPGGMSALASPDGPPVQSPEPSSTVSGQAPPEQGIRLLSGDGDTESRCDAYGCYGADAGYDESTDASGNTTRTHKYHPYDNVMDWAVGDVAASGQGVAFTTAPHSHARSYQPTLGQFDPQYAFRCDPATGGTYDAPSPTISLLNPTSLVNAATYYQNKGSYYNPKDPTKCQARSKDEINANERAVTLYKLAGYSLNGYTLAGSSGIGWAVGDRGGLWKIGEGTAPAEAVPAAVGARDPATVSDRSPYEAFRPLTAPSEAGLVPALAARPASAVSDPQVVAAGEVKSAAKVIVMSRDGSEGWAFPGPSHYANGRWAACDPNGSSADDAPCKGLAGVGDPVAAARVPYENASDPSNNRFEVVAIVDRNTVMRYSGGIWTRDADASNALNAVFDNGIDGFSADVAFTSPDDGWIVTIASGGGGVGSVVAPRLLHFGVRADTGELGWTTCQNSSGQVNPPASDDNCGDPGNRLAMPGVLNGGSKAVLVEHLLAVGRRTYLYGARLAAVDSSGGGGGNASQTPYPMIVYHDAGAVCTKSGGPGCWTAEPGGDPGVDAPTPDHQGQVGGLAIAQASGGGFEGWAAGTFNGSGPTTGNGLLRLAASGAGAGGWIQWAKQDAARDYVTRSGAGVGDPGRMVALGAAGGGGAVIAANGYASGSGQPVVSFDPNPGRERWAVLPVPWEPEIHGEGGNNYVYIGAVNAIAPDGQGGVWLQVCKVIYVGNPPCQSQGFYHYTSHVPRPVFDEVALPGKGEEGNGISAGADGSVLVAGAAGTVYRYDRLTGWDTLRIPGWDFGRVVTRPAPVSAVAVGADGSGVAVGPGGRIADVAARATRAGLDAAAGRVCDQNLVVACGTGWNLVAAAVADDGSALVGGEHRALLWRPAGGEFGRALAPETATSATITGIALPQPDHAWLSTSLGQVFAGTLSAGQWSWKLEDLNANDDLLTANADGKASALNAIAVDAHGHGFAVGAGGMVLERSAGGGDRPWKRLDTGFGYDLYSVALPAGGGPGALVGGARGVVLTWVDGRFQVAQYPDPFDPKTTRQPNVGDGGAPGRSAFAGVALAPGPRPGQVEAWAGPGLHYASDPSDPLLNPDARARPQPDSPAPRAGEVSFAAFGKSECSKPPTGRNATCHEMTGSNLSNERIARRVAAAIVTASKQPGGPDLAVFTGDATDFAGGGLDNSRGASNGAVATPVDAAIGHRRWGELVAGQLADGGVPTFAAVGGQDLSQTGTCASIVACAGTASGAGVLGGAGTGTPAVGGLNLPWRHAFAGMPAPWGQDTTTKQTHGPFSFAAVPDLTGSVREPEGNVDTNLAGKNPDYFPTVQTTGGAATHYAVDVVRDGKALLRVVFVDTSQRSLAASDPGQQPHEAGGQRAWLASVLCTSATSPVDRCRAPGEGVVVVSNTPTYSYGPGTPALDTQTDATDFETLLLANRVNAVVSGRLGWNGLYYARAAGVHEPCPGDPYPAGPPSGDAHVCGASASVSTDPNSAADQLSQKLQGLGAPAPPVSQVPGTGVSLSGGLPFAVAASAGGKFGPLDNPTDGTAAQGFWHGYTVVRVDSSGDPAATIVEQRPVFDWVGMSAVEHTLRSGQHVTLSSYGREPIGMELAPRYDEISGPNITTHSSITHRFDLVQADPQRPYLPKVDEALKDPVSNPNGYVPLDKGDCSVGCVDSQTGKVLAGRGNHPRVYAIAILSVGEKAATWPMVFEPRRSYRPPALPALHASLLPFARVLAAPATSLPSVQPPPNPPPPNFTFPQPPGVPNLPPLSAPAVRPPTPPVPPPPPANASPSALSIAPAAVGLNVAPPATVIPPAAPPIQPAPPGGARREARQRQAAAAKSEEGAQNAEDAAGDLAKNQSPDPAAFTRRDRTKPDPSITMIGHSHQASAWSREALYGGAIGLTALVLALGFTLLRPGPRRRHPDIPAPAFNRYRRR